ncbi:hypothetical protein AOQ84DRAFT_265864, partial [Glonium stellatum]
IAISATVGLGVFVNGGEALRVAGPGGAILAFTFVGLIAIAVMECIAEMIGIWPVSNPFREFLKAFVDEDLATLCNFWGMSTTIKALLLFIVCPVILYCINFLGVYWYGIIEAVIGTIKIISVVGAFALMIAVNHNGRSLKYPSTSMTASRPTTMFAAVVPACFAYIGVEAVAITAFKAKDQTQLRLPVKFIAWVVTALYIFAVAGFVSNVKWCDPNLPLPTSWAHNRTCSTVPHNSTLPHQSTAIYVIALMETGEKVWPAFITGALVFSVISTANTNLYVASRSLFGMTRRIDKRAGRIRRIFAKFGTVYEGTGVPAWAVFISTISFCWLPFIRLHHGDSVGEVINILSTMGSTGCLCVWASQCLAYIRYHSWQRRHNWGSITGNLTIYRLGTHRNNVRRTYPRLYRWGDESLAQHRSFRAYFQPAWAWFGLISSLAIVFIFNSASWWHGHITKNEVIAAY